jgi:hypothetical protein
MVAQSVMRISAAAALAMAGLPLATLNARAATGDSIGDADCDAVWKQAGGKTLTADAAKPYVTNFEQVDIDKDGSIDYREFKDGCKAGLVKKSG